MIRFESSAEKAGFLSPLAGMAFTEQVIEVRRDPLTGATAISSPALAAKEEVFLGRTDWEHAEELGRRSRPGCFFCPEKVLAATPRYPDAVVEGGRLTRGRALAFPNLFPLAALHAVVTFPERHFLRPSGFAPDLLEDGLGAAVDLAARAERALPGLAHLEVCCNHMLPAGASLVHPHLQVLGGPGVPSRVRSAWEASAAFRDRHGVSYWEALVAEERARGERFVGEEEGCAWLVPFAPAGNREVVAVVPGAARVSALRPGQVAVLARGLSRVLAWYEREALSAFNFTLGGGPPAPGPSAHPVVLRVIARSAFRPDYRADEYFLQKQLGSELVFQAPENVAATLRPCLLSP